MAVVCWVTQVCYANFNNTHMVLMKTYSVVMLIQPILSDNDLWVLFEVLQPLYWRMLGINQWVNSNICTVDIQIRETIISNFLDFKKSLKLQLKTVDKKYIVCYDAKCKNMLVQWSTSEYFRVPPILLAFYFNKGSYKWFRYIK